MNSNIENKIGWYIFFLLPEYNSENKHPIDKKKTIPFKMWISCNLYWSKLKYEWPINQDEVVP